MCYCNGMAAVFACLPIAVTHNVIIMNQTISMGHAPAIRAYRALLSVNVQKVCSRALALVRRKSLTLAAISATLSVAGVALASDPLTYSAAFAALGFARLANSGQKGGEK